MGRFATFPILLVSQTKLLFINWHVTGLRLQAATATVWKMICADFLAGANLDDGDPEMLLFSMTRFFKFLPGEQKQAFLGSLSEKASSARLTQNPPPLRRGSDLVRESTAAGVAS